MKRALILIAIGVFIVNANAQNVLTGKEIYRASRDGVVQILVGGHFSGTGFLISADGLIITANHVVATKESRFKTYAAGIEVITAQGRFPATPFATIISEDQANYDFALLKIGAIKMTYLSLGDWNDVDIGDRLIIIPSFQGMGSPLLEGIVANKGAATTELGPKPVNTILFQCPVRNGFSGAPIFGPSGKVVAIVNTKVFGISPPLDDMRKKLSETQTHSAVIIQGVSFAPTMIELVNVLDQNLISGLGTGVDISYAKKQQQSENK